MAGIIRPQNKQIIDPQTNRLTLEWDAYFARLEALATSGGGGGGGGVTTFEGRSGAVVGVVGDYDASEITNVPAGTIAATDVQGALAELDGDIAGKQAADATLTALAAFNTDGLLTQVAADTFAGRTLAAPAAGLTITNPAGIAGNPTFALANDLAAVEGLSTTGLAARTAADTWATRTLTGPAAGIGVTNGDGVSGNPTLALANDLAAVEALSGTGLAARTAADTWASRTLTGPAAGISVTNGGGVAGNPTLALANDLAALEGLGATGIAVRTTTDTWVQRTLAAPVAGLSITDPGGVAGNPTFALANDIAALEGLASTGIAVRSAADTWLQRSVVGGTAITVTNGDGVSGNPSVAITAGGVGTTQLADNGVTMAKLEDAGAYTILLRNAGTTGDPAYTKISALTDASAFGTGDKLVIEESTGELRKIDFDDLPGATGGGASPGDFQRFDADDTWNKPSGFGADSVVRLRAWGGAGSGARNSSAGGGGGGGYSERWVQLSEMGSTETITIGDGGAAITTGSANGNAGGNTTIGSLLTGYAGAAGTASSTAGGGGGGQLSAASGRTSGNPAFMISVDIITGYGATSGIAAGYGYDQGGGGGGHTAPNGGSSVRGGGGGAGNSASVSGSGGISIEGGAGGASGINGANGTDGAQPGGGGGAAENTGTARSGAGSKGRVEIIVFDAT